MEKMLLIKGDITQQEVDAIVNAANSSLMGGGGVDGAIHRAGGPAILEECKDIRRKCGKCPTGQAVITTAGELPAKKVIHTVGPVWGDQEEEESKQLLASCYQNSLQLAAKNGLKTIAFPNISTGVYGFPKQKAALVAIDAVRSFLDANGEVEEVRFVCFDKENHAIYQELLGEKNE